MSDALIWTATFSLLILGLIGSVVPFLPGHLFILLAAVVHRLGFGSEGSGLGWWTFVILGLIMLASQLAEFFSGAAGAKWFGGSRWGALGAVLGGVVGLFLLPLGMVLGPLIGAVVGELAFGRCSLRPAIWSGTGSVVGIALGMGIKLIAACLMLGYLLADLFWF